MARASLAVVLAMAQPGCLVTSTPEFTDPEPTPPFLLASSADPDPRQILVVQPDEVVRFRVSILSEDGGQDVQVRLLSDYGVRNVVGCPFFAKEGENRVAPGTIEGGPRRVDVNWPSALSALSGGCHTITMIASHAFDQSGRCPSEMADSSQITWPIMMCTELECPPPIANPELDCPKPTTGCPEQVTGDICAAAEGSSP